MVELRGSLQGMGMQPLVHLLAELRKTGCLHLANDHWSGDLHFADGRLVRVTLGSERGLAALDAMLVALPDATFTFSDAAASDVAATASAGEPDVPPDELKAHFEAATQGRTGLVQRIPSMDAVPAIVDLDDRTDGVEHVLLDRTTVQTLLRVNGQRSVRDVVGARPLAQSLRDLAQLVDLGLVRMRTAPAAAPPADRPAAAEPSSPAAPPPLTREAPLSPAPVESVRPTAPTDKTCPKLGFADDPSRRYSRPTSLHRCFASGAPASVTQQEQVELCLSGQFLRCPRLAGLVPAASAEKAATSAPAPAATSASAPASMRRPIGGSAPSESRLAARAASPAPPQPDFDRPSDRPSERTSDRTRPPAFSVIRGGGADPADGDAGRNHHPAERPAAAPAGEPPGLTRRLAPLDSPESSMPAPSRAVPAAPTYRRPNPGRRPPRRLLASLVLLGAILVALAILVLRPMVSSPELTATAVRTPPAAQPAGIIRPTPVAQASAAPAAAVPPPAPAAQASSAPAAVPPPGPAAQASSAPAAAAPSPAPVAVVPGFHPVLDAVFTTSQPQWIENGQLVHWADGAYRLAALQPTHFVAVGTPLSGPLGDVVVSATLRKIGGPPGGGYGVIVRDQGPGPRDGDNQNGSFYVAETGDRGEVGIWRRENDRWVDLLPWTRTDAVRQGGSPNTLTVRAVGAEITFLVNGTEVARRTDATLPSGGVGVFVGGDGNAAALDRFTVQVPD